MGVGDPASLVEAVALGVDQFDCVLPTRLGRHGTVLTDDGPAQPAQRPLSRSTTSPLDAVVRRARCARATPGATCATCLQVGEPTAARLLTLHNVGLDARASWTGCATAIVAGTFEAFRASRPRHLGLTVIGAG